MMLLRPPALLRGLVLWIALGAPWAGAQCQPRWRTEFAPPGLDATVLAQAIFDDGSGPALYVAGSFTKAAGQPADHIARWDGSTWSALPAVPFWSPTTVSMYHDLAVFDDGSGAALYVATGTSSFYPPVVRWDGTGWSALPGGISGVDGLEVLDDGSGPALYTVGSSGIHRWIGFGWSAPWGSVISPSAVGVYDDGTGPVLHAGGNFGSFYGIGRWDGAAWTQLGSGVNGRVKALRVWDDGSGPALYAGGGFTTAGGLVANAIARWDGSSWSLLGSGMSGGSSNMPWVLSLGVRGTGRDSRLIAAGDYITAGGTPARCIAEWDGSSWQGFAEGTFFAARDLAFFDEGKGPALHVCGSFQRAGTRQVNHVARWDGASWRALGQSRFQGLSRTVHALATLDLGSDRALYAGGEFVAAGSRAVNGIARWDGTTWSPLGSGIQAPWEAIMALEVFDDGTGPLLHAGGLFTGIGGVPALNVARWDGSAWTPLGTGVDSSPRAFAVFDEGSGPALYVGGDFTSAGGLPDTTGIARWDGLGWSAVGGGLTPPPMASISVEALAVHDDGNGPALYAGGQFSDVGGITAHGVARWDGSSWTPAGGGVATSIHQLAVVDLGGGPILVAAGTGFGGVGQDGVAHWNGSSWSLIGAVLPGAWRLGISGATGAQTLYAAGQFSQVGGTPAANVARWDGSSWSPLGSGIAGTIWPYSSAFVNDLAAFDDGSGPALFAGGAFTTAGGQPSAGIAAWGLPRPSLSMFQGWGPGSPTWIMNTRLLPGHEYYNLFSAEPCPGGPGGGPYLGLCASTPLQLASLATQFLLPVGSPPSHVLASDTRETFGPVRLPPGLVVDGVCFEFSGGQIGCASAVVRLSVL